MKDSEIFEYDFIDRSGSLFAQKHFYVVLTFVISQALLIASCASVLF